MQQSTAVGFADQTPLDINRARLLRVQRALQHWEAHERGEEVRPSGLRRRALESLRDTLGEVIAEQARYPISGNGLAGRQN